MLKLTFRAMGSQIEVLYATEAPEAQQALEQVPAWFEGWEQSLSRFRPDSELSSLNDSQDKPVRVSSTLWSVLLVSLKAFDESGGLVTPAILDALESAGYNRSFELLNGVFNYQDFHGIIPDVANIGLDINDRSVHLPEGIRLDFGGSAKGWAAHQAAKRLARIAPVLVNAGGDIAFNQANTQKQHWEIGVVDPFHSDRQIENVRLTRGGIATSGTDYRRWQHDGFTRNHLIDPRSGISVVSDVISATVIARNVMTAEMAAKTALLLGSQKGIQWLEVRPDLAGLLILEDGKIAQTKNFKKYKVNQNEREFAQ